ncbi:MAG: EVE domain-containing protein [Chthoniobacterales bacterium]
MPSIGVCRLVWWAVLSESGDRAVADWRPSQIVATFAAVNYWLVKSEPSAYSWENLVGDKSTSWTGVRNFTARNNLRAMRLGDEVLFYHSVTEKAVVGVATVVREAYRDSTAKEGDWSAVDLKAKHAFKQPVSLDEIKGKAKLKGMALLRLSRLSVQPVTSDEFQDIVRIGRGA